jgi:hypothetical protein
MIRVCVSSVVLCPFGVMETIIVFLVSMIAKETLEVKPIFSGRKDTPGDFLKVDRQ